MTKILQIPEKEIMRVARRRFKGEPLPKLVVRQAVAERILLKARKKVDFRRRNNQGAVEAYCAMDLNEFHGINARQDWANWRTIPRNLNGRVPNRPLDALDLCCGTGQSTEILAFYLPEGSRLLGLEFNPAFVEKAQQKKYRDATGRDVRVSFRAQSVLETFIGADGQPVATSSVDLINCAGAIGHHFDRSATLKLVTEVARVLRPGGLAMLDSGPKGTPRKDVIQIARSLGLVDIKTSRSCWVDLNPQTLFIRLAETPAAGQRH